MNESIADFIFRVRLLDSIDRCSNTPHIKKYPVSTHSFYTALYSMMFADIENERESNTTYYDTSEVIKKALLHDIEETITGDILYPIKHNNNEITTKLKDIAIQCIENEVFKGLPDAVKVYYINLWKASKDSSIEGQLVAAVEAFHRFI